MLGMGLRRPANERSPSGRPRQSKSMNCAMDPPPLLPCGRASLAHADAVRCGAGGHRLTAVQRRTPIPAVHVLGTELEAPRGAGSATTRRPPWPPLHCTPVEPPHVLIVLPCRGACAPVSVVATGPSRNHLHHHPRGTPHASVCGPR